MYVLIYVVCLYYIVRLIKNENNIHIFTIIKRIMIYFFRCGRGGKGEKGQNGNND
jgi:hypothetical protein